MDIVAKIVVLDLEEITDDEAMEVYHWRLSTDVQDQGIGVCRRSGRIVMIGTINYQIFQSPDLFGGEERRLRVPRRHMEADHRCVGADVKGYGIFAWSVLVDWNACPRLEQRA